MTYQPLARKYRPKLFSELVGQDAVSIALANAIKRNAPPPVILFTGIRGVGKTTVARLYAKALNCDERTPDAEPCNACESCVAISRGVHEDVVEIDGASNTGVSDVRALQETLEYVPQRKKYKVYIIDEVHMLSQAAFNALLKTLEEPRAHVVFIFATTEIHKVPQTILSRCQTFYLKKLPLSLIRDRLSAILQHEGIEADPKAVSIVAREGHGSMRDALTMLDQTIALGAGHVTLEALGPIISNLSSSPYLQLLDALVRRNAQAALDVIERLDAGGVEFQSVAEELAGFARHAFVLRDLGPKALDAALLGLDDAELEQLRRTAADAGGFDLNRIFRTLVKCRGELDGSALDRYVFENYVFEWCFDPGFPDIDSLLSGEVQASTPARTGGAPVAQSLREALSPAGKPAPVVQVPASVAGHISTATPAPAEAPAPTKATAPAAEPATGSRFPATWRQLVDAWKREKPFQARKLEEAHPIEYSKDAIVLAVSEDSYASKVLLQNDEQARIRAQFREVFDFNGVLSVVPSKEAIKARTGATADASPQPASAGPTGGTPTPTAPAPQTAQAAAAPRPAAPSPQAAAQPSAGKRAGPDSAILPETILTEKTREAADRRTKLIDAAENAPFTKELLAELGGRIDEIRVTGDMPR